VATSFKVREHHRPECTPKEIKNKPKKQKTTNKQTTNHKNKNKHKNKKTQKQTQKQNKTKQTHIQKVYQNFIMKI